MCAVICEVCHFLPSENQSKIPPNLMITGARKSQSKFIIKGGKLFQFTTERMMQVQFTGWVVICTESSHLNEKF